MASSKSSIARILDSVKKTAMTLGGSELDRVLHGSGGPQLRVRFRFDFSVGRTDPLDTTDRLLLTVTVGSEDVSAWLRELGYAMEDGEFAGAYFSQYATFNTDISTLEHAAPVDLQAVVQDAKDFTTRLADTTQTPLQLLQVIERDKAWRQEFFRMTAFRALVIGIDQAVDVASTEIARLGAVKFGGARNLSELESYIALVRARVVH